MPREYCGQVPCAPMIRALGRYVFGGDEPGDGFYMYVYYGQGTHLTKEPIEYCPFCGTILEEEWVTKVKSGKFTIPKLEEAKLQEKQAKATRRRSTSLEGKASPRYPT